MATSPPENFARVPSVPENRGDARSVYLIRGAGISLSKLTTCYLLVCFVFIYLEVFILPAIPLVAYGDQAIYLLNGARMLHGQVIYRDFFGLTFPGTACVYAALFWVFGIRAWIPQAALILIGTGMAWLSVLISKRLVKGWAVFLPGLLFITFPFRNALDATHHWYAVFAVIGALAVTIESRTRGRLAAAGALCGLATWFTQSHGLAGVIGFGVFLVWENRRKSRDLGRLVRAEAWLLGSYLAAVIALNAYFVGRAGLHKFLYCTVVFVLRFYPSEWFNTWRIYMIEHPSAHSWLALPAWGSFLFIFGVTPLVYILFFVRYWRVAKALPSEPWERLVLVNIIGLFLFASVANSPSYLRMCSVCLPALIILVWFASQRRKPERLIWGLLWLITLVLLVAGPLSRQRHWRGYLDLPTGRTAFLRHDLYDEYQWVFDRSRPPEYFFGDQLMTFALGLRDPAPVDFITPSDYTRPEQVASVVQALESDEVRYVLWRPQLNLPPASGGDQLGPLRAYLRTHYHMAKVFANGDQAWERNGP